MTVQMLKGKIHRATVKQAELNYVGSITVDADLLDAAGIYEYEKVAIVDIENGNRFETYTIAGERGSGMICLNGVGFKAFSVVDIYNLHLFVFQNTCCGKQIGINGNAADIVQLCLHNGCSVNFSL